MLAPGGALGRQVSVRADAIAIARAGIAAADPATSVERVVRLGPGSLMLGPHRLPLPPRAGVHLAALGKAASEMIDAAARRLGDRLRSALAVLPEGTDPPRFSTEVLVGEHPVPGAGSFRAGRRLLDYVHELPADDRLVFLISGGGSALAEVPAGDIPEDELAGATRTLLASGAPIQSLNVLRRHLSRLKGGQLGRAATPTGWGTVAISDVVGDTPWDIASGPTVPDPTTFVDAWDTVERYHLEAALPGRVMVHLRAGRDGHEPETPKRDDPRLRAAPFVLAATNRGALDGAAREAERRGYRPQILSSRIVGETQDVACMHAELLREVAVRPAHPATCLLSGGETTVRVGSNSSRGGRNQEFALAAAPILDGLRGAALLSVGTDGIDGPTDAAGGVVTGETARRARSVGVDVAAALERHASYDALDRLGALLRTGRTGTNVMDLHVGLVARAGQSGYGRK